MATGPRSSVLLPGPARCPARGRVARGAVIALALLPGLLSCAREPATRPSIVILSLDTLRADHLAVYGYPRWTSPELDAVAAQGVTFREARCQSTATLTSHLSLMTSLLPDDFRITRPDGENVDMFRTRLRLADAVTTLGEALHAHGYETAAFTGGGFVAARYGFDQGFDVFEENRTRFDGFAATFPRLRDFLQRREERPGRNRSKPPLFLFVHTYDIHEPYRARSPFDRFFSRRTLKSLSERLGYAATPAELNQHLEDVDAEMAGDVRDLYDNGIRATDMALKWFFELLRQHGLYDDAIVVVLSDHGEEFLDHGRFGHGATVYEELAHVPLLLRLPGARHRGRIVTEPVALLDLAPTLLELAGAPVPDSFRGRSLVPLLEGRSPAAPESRAFLLHDPTVPEVRGLLRDGWKLIDLPDARKELYDLDTDPAERHDEAATSTRTADLAADLAARVDRAHEEGPEHGWEAVPMEGEQATMSDEAREQLEALGYAQ